MTLFEKQNQESGQENTAEWNFGDGAPDRPHKLPPCLLFVYNNLMFISINTVCCYIRSFKQNMLDLSAFRRTLADGKVTKKEWDIFLSERV